MVRELIRLEGVHRAFGAVSVLDGINLRIDEGDRIDKCEKDRENATSLKGPDNMQRLQDEYFEMTDCFALVLVLLVKPGYRH